jgi:UDP-N-acetylglucosamine 2-epimerase (non-hydrolysing)
VSKRIDIIAGARPNFMKIAPIIEALRETPLKVRLIHTGQHYDPNLSDTFFEQLGIPAPDVNLGVGSGSPAEQTGAIMVGYEKVLQQKPTDFCLVVGDVTSTMACTITAKKMNVRCGHVEAGIRSGDLAMPEEINRMVTDALCDLFFTTSETANAHLRRAGIEDARIHFVGNTMIDTLLKQRQNFTPPDCWDELQLQPDSYVVLTLHRPNNVDATRHLADTLDAILAACPCPVIFPVHPRTRKMLDELNHPHPQLHLLPPLPYLSFNYLVEHAKAVITDSGGITEETTVLGIPCLTLRDNTERPETVTIGTNELVGTDPAKIAPHLERLFSGGWKTGAIPALWDGHTGPRIAAILAREV